ncbi:peptidase S24/S26A/S26B/S26C [Dipodascopsis tothii]|uniref:peptidase S24/S26A/S26B/S26C n=1 Tax=Dipodascopsis tothii TaxID=44089 RepID=UPI0034CDBB49
MESLRRASRAYRQHRHTVHAVARDVAIGLSWLPVAVWTSQHVVSLSVVDGQSMTPTLNPDSNELVRDVVAVWKWRRSDAARAARDDIVVLRSPRDPETEVVKRVVAVGGDVVRSRGRGTLQRVPEGHIWVEGDNVHSIDSNHYGPVSEGLVVGRVTHVVFPPSRLGPVH